MNALAAMPDGEIKGFGLIRDKDGRPKVDDPQNLAPEIKAMLTEEERLLLGISD